MTGNYIATIRGLLYRGGSSRKCASWGLLPLDITTARKFQYQKIITAKVTVWNLRHTGNYIAPIRGLLYGVCDLCICTAVGLLPLDITTARELGYPKIPASANSRRITCYDVPSIWCLLYGISLINTRAPVGLLPLNITTACKFQYPSIFSASVKRVCRTCNYVAAVRGLLNCISIVITCTSIGLHPWGCAGIVCTKN